MEDVEALCREFGITCEPARGGSSHYKIAHALMARKLTIPFKRPIKPVYTSLYIFARWSPSSTTCGRTEGST